MSNDAPKNNELQDPNENKQQINDGELMSILGLSEETTIEDEPISDEPPIKTSAHESHKNESQCYKCGRFLPLNKLHEDMSGLKVCTLCKSGKISCIGLLILAIVLHFVFCNWSFDDSTTRAYCIIVFSEKPNPYLSLVSARKGKDLMLYGARRSDDEPMLSYEYEEEQFTIVNGLFARNNLFKIGETVNKSDLISFATRMSYRSDETKFTYVGMAPEQDGWVLMAEGEKAILKARLTDTHFGRSNWLLLAVFFGMVLPLFFILAGSTIFCIVLYRQKTL